MACSIHEVIDDFGQRKLHPFGRFGYFFLRQIDDTSSIDEWGACLMIVGRTQIELGSLSLEVSYVECAKGEDLEGNQVPVLPLWWKGWSECQQGPACESQSMQSSVPSHWQHITLYRFIPEKVRRIFSTWRTAGRDRRSRNLLETLKMANITSNFKPEKKHQGIQLGW